MAAPAIPPIRLGLIGTGLAVEELHRPSLRGLADRCAVTAFTDRSTSVVGENFFYRNDLRHARASLDGGAIGRPHFGVWPVGGVAQGVANAMVVQRAFDSAERTTVLTFDPVPGAGPVPLWPRGSTGLFTVLPGQRVSSSASFAA